jgi:hypothetical protein
VRDEDVSESRQGYSGRHQLPGNTVTAVNDIGNPAAHYHLCGRRARRSRTWPTAGAEQDESGALGLRHSGAPSECSRSTQPHDKVATTDPSHVVGSCTKS